MRIDLSEHSCTLLREYGDKAISKESTVCFHMRRLLNLEGWDFRRIDPRRYGMTDCRVGARDRKRGVILWHERYQIEAAHKAFNEGHVSFQRINTKEDK